MPRIGSGKKRPGICYRGDCQGVRTPDLKAHEKVFHVKKMDGFLCNGCLYGATCYDINLFSKHLATVHGLNLAKHQVQTQFSRKIQYDRPIHCGEADCNFATLTEEKLKLHSTLVHVQKVFGVQELEEEIRELMEQPGSTQLTMRMVLQELQSRHGPLEDLKQDVRDLVDEIMAEQIQTRTGWCEAKWV